MKTESQMKEAALNAANAYFARAEPGKPLDATAIKHVETILDHFVERGAKAMILAGKAAIQQKIGDDAAMDFYKEGRKLFVLAVQAQLVASFIHSCIETDSVPTRADIEGALMTLLLDGIDKNANACRLGSSIIHLMERD